MEGATNLSSSSQGDYVTGQPDKRGQGTAGLDFTNKVILAPMVRVCTLPMRLLALEYGADIVYCEEIIDFKILNAKRIENDLLGTMDYVLSDKTVVFRTHPSEKSRLVFQLGTADAQRALRAARKVEHDVSGIDVNMGCPKEFSIKGGMGAALLTQPEKIKEILTTLVNGLSVPVTCKIRVLPQLEDTLGLVKVIESTGVRALAVHGRIREERPRHPNRNHVIKKLEDTLALVKVIESTGVRALAVHGRIRDERPRHPNRNHVIRKVAETVSIPVIANGGSKDIKDFCDIEKFREDTGASSVMIARAAEWNPSVLRKEGKLDLFQVIRRYLKYCIDYDNEFTNSKYCILMMMHADMDKKEGLDTQDSKCFEEICDIWGVQDYHKEVLQRRKQKTEDIDKYHGIKRRKLEDGKILIEMPLRFIKKDYPVTVSPKLKLYEWTKKNKTEKPQYVTTEREGDRCYKCVLQLEGRKYTIAEWEKSKQLAEQGAAVVALTVLGEDDGRKADTDSPNDEITRVWREHFQMSDMNIHKNNTEASGKIENVSINSSKSENDSIDMTSVVKQSESVSIDSTKMTEQSEAVSINRTMTMNSDIKENGVLPSKMEVNETGDNGTDSNDVPISSELSCISNRGASETSDS